MTVDYKDLEVEKWETLVDSILAGECTAFLGAGVAWPHLPSGRELALQLAKQHGYPLSDPHTLSRVTQYLATTRQPAFARRKVSERIAQAEEDYLAQTGGIAPANYDLLAELRLPVYITTNYDGFLVKALTARGRPPHKEICRWNDQLWDELGTYPEHSPTREAPIVFHLHGDLTNKASILVTEDDYIDFTVSLALRETEQSLLWHQVRRALSRTTLLFIGYSLDDWNFRVLMRFLLKQQKVVRSEQAFSLSIQLSDSTVADDERQRAEEFLTKYLAKSAIDVHWSDASGFLRELSERVATARK